MTTSSFTKKNFQRLKPEAAIVARGLFLQAETFPSFRRDSYNNAGK